MKIFIRLLIVILAAALFAGYFYWQKNKKGIIKTVVQEAVQKKLTVSIICTMTVRILMK